MDTELLDGLIDILEEETALYNDVLKLSKSKTDIIIQGNVTELQNITRIEQNFLLKLGKLENTREEFVARISEIQDVDPSGLTITGLQKILPESQAERLGSCCKSLAAVIADLHETNGLNSKLIKNSLDYIDFSLNLFSNAGPNGSFYGNSGRESGPRKRNFFDMKL